MFCVKKKDPVAFSLSMLRNMMCVVLGYKEPRARWYGQEELYSLGAEVDLYRRLCLGTVTNTIGTFVFREESVCTDVLGSGNVLPEFS